jgi:predicted amidohydrolase
VLRVTVIELPATWGDPVGALAMAETELDRGPPTDLVLLPEASLTGYVSSRGDFDLAPFAEAEGGPTAKAIADLARRRRVNLVAPLVLREREEGGGGDKGAGRRCSNAMVAFDRRGEPLFTYRKRHPWLPETWATAGSEAAPIVDIEGTRVTIAICYDLHFLDEDAADALTRADLLLFPSAWVEAPDSRPALLAELAMRYRVAVANANWAPGVVRVPGQGNSLIINARGKILARVGPHARRADALIEPSPR